MVYSNCIISKIPFLHSILFILSRCLPHYIIFIFKSPLPRHIFLVNSSAVHQRERFVASENLGWDKKEIKGIGKVKEEGSGDAKIYWETRGWLKSSHPHVGDAWQKNS